MLYRHFATTDEIDAEYDMSQVVGDPGAYFEFYINESARARSDLDCLLDMRFGPTVEETLDIFPAAEADAPIVVFIHGGYWRRLSSREFSFVARGLVGRGITAVVTNYALCPKVTIPEITRQTRAALAWLKTTDTRYHGDRERIYAAGHSAGGHLAVRALCTDWAGDYALPADLVKGAYAFSGLYDLRPIRYASIQSSLQLTGDVIQRESPLLNLPAAAGPLITEVGGEESAEFRRQSAEFVTAWCAAGLSGRHAEQAGKNHFTIINELLDPGSALCERITSFVSG